jgi:NAD-dependent DNA ligase
MSTLPLDGLRFVITGEFGEARKSIVNKLIAMGAVWHRKIGDKTNLLIVGTDPGEAKLRTVHAMGIPTADRKWLVNALALGGYTLGAVKIEVESV